MHGSNRAGKINIKVLVIVLVATIGLAISFWVARKVGRKILSQRDLEAGTVAYDAQNWTEAVKRLQDYLSRNPDDIEILEKYGHARLSMRPLESPSIGQAIAAYRRIMQLDPLRDVAYEKLAILYPATGNYADLAHIARRRLEVVPDDKTAPVWLAEAMIQLNKADEAQQKLEEYTAELDTLPDKYPDYVRACALMAQIVSNDDYQHADPAVMTWLDRAVAYAPESAEALAQRAAVRREMANASDVSETGQMSLLALAREDLQAADDKGSDSVRVLYFLAREWLLHGDLDRAEAQIEAAKALPQDKILEEFFDIADWQVALFSLESQLATEKGDLTHAAALADEALATLTQKRHRIQILPSAIQLYVAVDDAEKARECLEEYVDAQYTETGVSESRIRLAYLRALVARAESNAYGIIDILQPVVVSDASRPELWRLLAEAYSRTDQPRRAVGALIRYLRIRPRDPQMTLELAKEYLKLRDWNRAFETARLAEPLDPTNIVVQLLRIEASIYVAAEAQQVDETRLNALADELARLRSDYPERVDIRVLQAMIDVYREQPDLAIEELKAAIVECDEPLRAEMQLVRQYYRLKRMDEAVALGVEACERHSELAEPWLTLSGLYVSLNDNEEARDCLKEGLNATVGKWEKRSVTVRLALLELLDGDRAAGIDLLNGLAEQDTREVYARTLLLGTREIQQNPTRAQTLVDELRAAEGDSGLSWRANQARLWLRANDWRSRQREIADLLEQCIDADPEWSEPVLALADLYEKLSQPELIEDVCRQALLRNPAAADVADRLVGLLEGQRRFSDAQQVLDEVEAAPQVRNAWQIQMALRSSDFSGAIDELLVRVSNDDRDVESRILLARLLYWEMNDAEQANRWLDEAEAIDPTSMSLMALRASILRAEGQGQRAEELLNAYVANHEEFGAYYLRAEYHRGQSELEKAEADYRKLTTFPAYSVAGYALLSNFYATSGRLDHAIESLEEALVVTDEDPVIERLLMRGLFQRSSGEDISRALGLLDKLEKTMPDDPELMMLRVVQLLQDPTPESLAEATEDLEAVVRLEPTAIDAHLMLVDIYLQQGNYDKADNAALRALGDNPDSPVLLATRGRVELALKDIPMAVQLAELALDVDPNSVQAREVVVAAALEPEGRVYLQMANDLLRTVIRSGAVDDKVLWDYILVLKAQGRPQDATPELEAYCQTPEGAEDFATLVTLADAYRLGGNFEKAYETIARAAAIDPNSQAVVHARLLCLIAQKRNDELVDAATEYLSTPTQDPGMLLNAAFALLRYDPPGPVQAVRFFERLVELAPTSTEVQAGLAASLQKTGQVARSNEILAQLQAEYGSDLDWSVTMASYLYQIGFNEGAEAMYRDVLERDPENSRALNDLAWILQDQYQRYDEALALADRGLEAALALADRNPEAQDVSHVLDTRATILSHMPGRLADAKSDFERLVELSVRSSDRRARSLVKLARVCIDLGEQDNARNALQRALAIDEGFEVFSDSERAEIADMMP